MGILEKLRDMNEKKALRSEKFKEMQENYRLQKMLEDRQKSSNERELENYYKRKREQKIKAELDVIRQKQTKESWKGNSLLKGSNMLKDNRPILKEKNIFVDNRNDVPLTKKGRMFFQW